MRRTRNPGEPEDTLNKTHQRSHGSDELPLNNSSPSSTPPTVPAFTADLQVLQKKEGTEDVSLQSNKSSVPSSDPITDEAKKVSEDPVALKSKLKFGGDMINKLKMFTSSDKRKPLNPDDPPLTSRRAGAPEPPRKLTLPGDDPLPLMKKIELSRGEEERKTTLPGLEESGAGDSASNEATDDTGKFGDHHHPPHHHHRHGVDDEPASPRTPRGTSHRRPVVPPLSIPTNSATSTPPTSPKPYGINTSTPATLTVAPSSQTSTTPRTPGRSLDGAPSTLSKQRKVKPPLPPAPPPSARLLAALQVIMAIESDTSLAIFSANPSSIASAPPTPAGFTSPLLTHTMLSSPSHASPTISPSPVSLLSTSAPQRRTLFPPTFSLKSSSSTSSPSEQGHPAETPVTPRSSTTPRPSLSADNSHSLHVDDEDSLVISAPLSPCEAYGDILSELRGTEERYVGDLQLLVTLFIKPIREKRLLSDRNITAIFNCAESIYKLNSDLLAAFKSATMKTIAQCWVKMPEILKFYQLFCGNQDTSSAVLQKKMKKANFRSFINETYKNPQLRKLQLRDLLIKPFQRLCRYTLLLREIQKNIESEETIQQLKKTADKIQEVIDRLNDIKKFDDNITKMTEIQNIIEASNGPLKIVHPSRRFLKEGFFKEWSPPPKSGMMDIRYFLFSDMLLRAKPSILSSRLQLKSQIPPDALGISTMSNDAKQLAGMNTNSPAFELNHIGTAKYIAIVNSVEELEAWVSLVEGIIKKPDPTAKKPTGMDPSLAEDMLSVPADPSQPKRRSYTLGIETIKKHLRHPSKEIIPPVSSTTPTVAAATPPQVSPPTATDNLKNSGASGTGSNTSANASSVGASASASAGAGASASVSASATSATASVDNASSDTDSDAEGPICTTPPSNASSSIAMLSSLKKGKALPGLPCSTQRNTMRFCCTFESNTRWVEVPNSVSVDTLLGVVSAKFGLSTQPRILQYTKTTNTSKPSTISSPGDVRECFECGARLTLVP
ncbi:calmodulin-binding protein [Pelomyxa schiedti]|nr:calmodulin-binding protein [Pelomyxa schiedti]